MRAWSALLDAILGPRCICGARVFPKDAPRHAYQVHR